MKIIRVVLLMGFGAVVGGCNTVYQNPATPYVQRIDTITFGAGNAQDVNAATHTIDPWPRYAGNRRIPGNGTRMVGAVDRYEGGAKAQSPGGSRNAGSGASPTGAEPAPPR
jgi:hypothetical protein